MKLLFSFYCFLFCLVGFSQPQNNQEKIKTLLDTYFFDDREIIHVQFNKSTYFNNEDIAFKGYVFSKNNAIPYFNTSNVQLTIYNDKEEVVQKQLLFASNGTFSGGIRLNKNFKSGKYLFHFYTNWMNNYKEDDSFSQIIEISAIDEPFYFKSTEPNWETSKITFFPEGGAIVDGMSNTIGVKIVDCNNRGFELNNILIFDSKSNEVSHFSTNKMGNGILFLTADLNEKYSAKVEYNGKTITQELPMVQPTGIAITYNNNLPNNKLAISIKTNEKGVEINQNKKYNLLIQQNGYSVLKEINFSNQQKDQTVIVDKKYLQNGVNSLRLIDENLNEITERLIYNYATVQPVVTLNAKAIANDSIVLMGSSNMIKAKISTTILPGKTIGIDSKKSILGTYYLNTYLENPVVDNYIYFDPENKNRKRDMDYLMQVQTRSKLRWENIKSNPPKMDFSFNKGLSIGGTIDGKAKQNETKSVSLISAKTNVFEKVKVDKDNTFKFSNLFVQDSTVYMLQLENEKNATIYSKMATRVVDEQTKFNLPIKFSKNSCPAEKLTGENMVFARPKAERSTIELKEVVLKAKKKEVFTHQVGTNITAQAYKINEREVGTILDFIGRNGFNTGISNNEVYIRSRRDSYNSGSPEVYIDNVLLFDFNLLWDLDIDTVDEIYMDRVGVSSSRINNASGSIKIYLKRGKENKFYISKSTTFIATGGFSKNIAFKNTNFGTQREFDALGTLNWCSNIPLNENQSFKIKFPKRNQTLIEVLIEGFTDDGQLISEIKKIPVSIL